MFHADSMCAFLKMWTFWGPWTTNCLSWHWLNVMFQNINAVMHSDATVVFWVGLLGLKCAYIIVWHSANCYHLSITPRQIRALSTWLDQYIYDACMYWFNKWSPGDQMCYEYILWTLLLSEHRISLLWIMNFIWPYLVGFSYFSAKLVLLWANVISILEHPSYIM